jgi:hypothetical protein
MLKRMRADLTKADDRGRELTLCEPSELPPEVPRELRRALASVWQSELRIVLWGLVTGGVVYVSIWGIGWGFDTGALMSPVMLGSVGGFLGAHVGVWVFRRIRRSERLLAVVELGRAASVCVGCGYDLTASEPEDDG